MRHRVLACDYDRTVASHGQAADVTVDALARVRSSGRRLVLVTGRTREELADVFERIELFDAIVFENGGLLVVDGGERLLGPPVSASLVDELRRREVDPVIVGRVICSSTWEMQAPAQRAIDSLGLDLRLTRNRRSAMILPPGIDKGTGLRAALAELDETAATTVAVGDGENDLALFTAAAVSAAVANAVDELKARATIVLEEPNGAGVRALAEALVENDLGELLGADRLAG